MISCLNMCRPRTTTGEMLSFLLTAGVVQAYSSFTELIEMGVLPGPREHEIYSVRTLFNGR